MTQISTISLVVFLRSILYLYSVHCHDVHVHLIIQIGVNNVLRLLISSVCSTELRTQKPILHNTEDCNNVIIVTILRAVATNEINHLMIVIELCLHGLMLYSQYQSENFQVVFMFFQTT